MPTIRRPAPSASREGGLAAEVLDLMEARSSDAVPAWLARRWQSALGAGQARTLRVHPLYAARTKGPGSAAFSVSDVAAEEAPSTEGVDATLADLVRARAPSSVNGTRVLAAFEAGSDVRFVVDLRDAGRGPGARDHAMLAVARRYFERLVEGETDSLTRLANRRLFQSRFDAGMEGWSGAGRAHFFAMLDVDRFKRVNDTFGHLYGDEILVHFANLMRRTFRAGDQIYRFGGEEFVVIYEMLGDALDGALTVERFRKAVEDYDFPGVGRVTVSVGFTRICGAIPAAMLIDHADAALYYAKAHGRNRVCDWDRLVAAGEIVPRAAPKADVTLF